LVPEGAITPAKGKSNVKVAIFTILAIHVVLLGGLLMQGCKRDGSKAEVKPETTTAEVAPMDKTEGGLPAVPTDPSSSPLVADAPTTAVVPSPATPGSLTVAPLAQSSSRTVSAIAPSAANTQAIQSVPVDVVAPPVDTTIGSQVHAVAKGEVLSTIAKKYHVSVKSIQDANPSVNPTKLQIGQKLNIPAAAKSESVASVSTPATSSSTVEAGVYVVKSGDALEKIARANGTTVKAIKALNNMKTDRVVVGKKLKLPATKAAAAPSAPAASAEPAPFTTPTSVASGPATTTVR